MAMNNELNLGIDDEVDLYKHLQHKGRDIVDTQLNAYDFELDKTYCEVGWGDPEGSSSSSSNINGKQFILNSVELLKQFGINIPMYQVDSANIEHT
jgi:hypothetical protein